MQQGIKKLQWFEYLKVVFLKILNMLLCQVFANQVTFDIYQHYYKVDDVIKYMQNMQKHAQKHHTALV